MPLLPQPYLNTVVCIENLQDNKYYPLATGFLVGFKSGQKNERDEDLYHVLLVTNRHVFENRKTVWLRFNRGNSSVRYLCNLMDDSEQLLWLAHPDKSVDVAALVVLTDKLYEDKIDFAFFPEDVIADVNKIKDLGIAAGDEVFVLGFPMGIAGVEKNYVIVRGGNIARFDDEILSKDKSFLIDAFVFPGNSGGPVILKPELTSIEGTTPVKDAFVVGLIKSYVTYTETAYDINVNPPQPRITFVQNSGLASVVPLDYVREIFLNLKSEVIAPQKQENQTTIVDGLPASRKS